MCHNSHTYPITAFIVQFLWPTFHPVGILCEDNANIDFVRISSAEQIFSLGYACLCESVCEWMEKLQANHSDIDKEIADGRLFILWP